MINEKRFSDTHETSEEIIEAIVYLANGNDEEVERIWNDPTEPERQAIWERVTKNGSIASTKLFWGENTYTT